MTGSIGIKLVLTAMSCRSNPNSNLPDSRTSTARWSQYQANTGTATVVVSNGISASMLTQIKLGFGVSVHAENITVSSCVLVHAWGDGANDLVIGRAVGETAGRLPEGIVVVDERDEISADFAAVQGAVALGFDAIEESLGALEHVAQGRVVVVAEDPFGEAKIEDRVEEG